jgi:hypothetical protein
MSTSYLQCSHCSKTYESFNTAHGKPSKLCPSCRENQQRADEKRKDRVRNYQSEAKRNLEGTWASFTKKTKENRNIEITITKETFLELIQKACFYCKYHNEDEINGIDRIDNFKGYTPENCIPACKFCNRMKHIFHPVFFIEKAKLIVAHNSDQLEDADREEFYLEWKEYIHKVKVPYIYMKRNSEEKRKIPFKITKQQYEEIIYQPCYLCGYKCAAGNGLDREDNTIREYTYENVKACCSSCNMMKAYFTKEEFLNKIISISDCNYPVEWLQIERRGFHMGGAKSRTTP